jgi:hypothetical protein
VHRTFVLASSLAVSKLYENVKPVFNNLNVAGSSGDAVFISENPYWALVIFKKVSKHCPMDSQMTNWK